jgi:hypothetical protein
MAKKKIVDVHTTHCCERHGCKYGDKDCTVKQSILGKCSCDLGEEEDKQMDLILFKYLKDNLTISAGRKHAGYDGGVYYDVSLNLANPETGKIETISTDSLFID